MDQQNTLSVAFRPEQIDRLFKLLGAQKIEEYGDIWLLIQGTIGQRNQEMQARVQSALQLLQEKEQKAAQPPPSASEVVDKAVEKALNKRPVAVVPDQDPKGAK